MLRAYKFTYKMTTFFRLYLALSKFQLFIWISTLYSITAATKCHAFYVPLSANACFILVHDVYVVDVNRPADRVLAVSLLLSQHLLPHTHTVMDLVNKR